MKTFFLFVIITILTLVPFGTANAQEQSHEFSVTNLQNNETLSVAYSMQGCWSGRNAVFFFTGDKVTVSTIGETSLSWNDREAIDAYLNRASMSDNGSCTTQVTMYAVLFRNDKEIAKKIIIDGSCFYNNPLELTLGALLHRIETEKFETSKWAGKAEKPLLADN